MNIHKLKVKVKRAAVKRKNKLMRGDYAVRDKAQKVISYASAVGQNITDDVTPSRQTSSQLFPFSQPRQQQKRNSQRRHHEEKHRKQHRSKRQQQPPQRPYNPYPLI
jgi:hypothetical protein